MLRESEARLRTLQDSAPSGIVVIDAETHIIVDANPAALGMIGASPEQAIGSVCHKYICPAEKGHCPITDLGQTVDNSERVLLDADGKSVPILKTVTSTMLDDRQHLLESFIDITERKQVEQMKDEFVSTVSHELRTPLASIIGFTEMLLSGQPGELTPTQREFLDISYQSSQRLLHLVEDLLAVSRIEAGRLQLSFEPLRMERLAASIVEAIKPLAEDKEIALSVESPAQLPSIEGDRNRLEQVINNLLSNAIKFTPEGGRVAITLAREDDHIKVGVADTGVGIPPDEISLLFQKFSRASSAAERAVEGTGLGLYISKAIVERHGGRIWAESALGKGSTFWFTLPLRQPKPAEVSQEELARDIAARFFDSSE